MRLNNETKPWQNHEQRMELTFWELGAEAFMVQTVIWPEANIDDVCCGCYGRRPGCSTNFTQEWRRLMWTIMDLERRTWFFFFVHKLVSPVIHWSVTSWNHKCCHCGHEMHHTQTETSVTHSHIVKRTWALTFNIQISEVEEDPMPYVHFDDPGAVHIVRVVAGILWRVDLSTGGCDKPSTPWIFKGKILSPLAGNSNNIIALFN